MPNSNKQVHNAEIVCKNQYHIVFCPKYRRKVLVCGVDERLRKILCNTAKENDIGLDIIEIMPDYVHLLIEIDTRQSVHMAVRTLKNNTSGLLRKEFPWLNSKIPSLWTRNYFCCTVGCIKEDVIKEYIDQQKNK